MSGKDGTPEFSLSDLDEKLLKLELSFINDRVAALEAHQQVTEALLKEFSRKLDKIINTQAELVGEQRVFARVVYGTLVVFSVIIFAWVAVECLLILNHM